MESAAEARNLMEEPGLQVAGYKKRRGFATTKGEDYEVALLCLLFLRALRHASDFFLASNHDFAGIFDDVVLFYRLKGDQGLGFRAILLQAKHKENVAQRRLGMDPFKLDKYLKSFCEIRQQLELPLQVGNREIQLDEIKLLLYSNAGCKVDDAADDVTYTPEVEHLKDFVNTGGRLLRISGAERLGLPQGEETSHFFDHLLLCTKQMSVEKADRYLEDELYNVLRLTSPQIAKELKTELKRVVKAWWTEIGTVRYLTAESQEWKKVLEIQVRRFNRDTLNIDTRLNLDFIEGLGAVNWSWICVRDEFQANTVRSRLFRTQRNSLVVSFKSHNDHLEEVQALWNSNICLTLVVDMSAVYPEEGSLVLQRLQEEARSDARKHLVVISRVKRPSGNWTEVPAEPTWSVLNPDTQHRLLETPVRLQGEAVVMRDIVGSYVTDVMTDEVINWLCDCETEIKVGTAMPAPLELYVPRCLERSSPNAITVDSLIATKTLLFTQTNISLEVLKRFEILFPFYIDKIKTIEYPTIVPGIRNDYDIRQLCHRFRAKGISGNISMEGFQGNVKEFIPFIWNCKEKIVVIEGPPGVGKSSFVTMMCSRVKEQFPETWVLRLDMGRHTDYIDDTDFREVKNIKQFLIRSLPEDANNLERQLLEHSLSVTGNVFLFLDAFDEVSPDFTKKCSDLLKGIAQTIRYRQMVVTTRPVTTRDIEESLGTKAFILPVFCTEEQNLFFKQFSEAKKKDVNEEEISSLHKIAGTVLEIPLLCRMAAEVLLRRREHRLHQYRNPWKKVLLYELFVEQSVKDRVAEKLELDISKPVAKKLLESHKNLHIHNLQGLAVRKLLPLDQLPPLSVSTVTPEEKLGLVVNLGGSVDFEHQTFAEYFLGCWLACHWQQCRRKFLGDVLLQDVFQFVATTFSWSLFDGLPLHEAVARGDVYAVRALASAGTMDRGGRSALHVAAMTLGDHREVWELLMVSRDDLNWKDNVLDTTAVKYAEFSENWEFADLCLEKGANVRDIKLLTSKEKINNAYTYAVEKDLATLFQFITRRHSIIFKNESPLHTAAASNSKAVMKVLTKMLSEIDIINIFRRTPLHESSIHGHVETVTLMDINMKNEYGETALMKTAGRGHLEVLKILIENGADLNMKNNLGSTALIEASFEGHTEVVQILLKNGADFNMKDNLDSTALIKAASGGHPEVVKTLLENGADLNMKNNLGSTALIEAASGGHLDLVKILLDIGTDLNMKTNRGSTALIGAASGGHLEVVKILLENGADLNIEVNGCTAFEKAVTGGHLKVVSMLLQNGADVDGNTLDENTPLMIAASAGDVEMVKMLLENGADSNMMTNLGDSPLKLAVSGGHLDVVNMLLENGAEINITTGHGHTALMEAASDGHEEMVELLLANGADLNLQSFNDVTALIKAASAGHVKVVKILLEKGADLNITTWNDETALTKAISGGHLEVVKILLESGADLNMKIGDDETALIKAASEGRLEVVKILLQNGADLNITTWDDETALTKAASRSHLEVVKILLEGGADVNMKIADDETALTKAASAGYLEVVKILLEKGADLNITTWNDETALIKAASGGHLEVVKILLEKGADLNMKTVDDETALTKAASGGHLEVVKILLEKGDDKSAMTKAASGGHQEIVKMLSEDLADLNINTEDDETTMTKEASGGIRKWI